MHLGFASTWGHASQRVEALFTRNPKTGYLERDIDENFKAIRVQGKIYNEVVDVISRGECGTTSTSPDPLLDWVFHGQRGADVFKPLPEAPSPKRQAEFNWMTVYMIHFALSRNGAYALYHKPSGKIVAGAITQPPNTLPFSKSFDEMGENIRIAGMAMG